MGARVFRVTVQPRDPATGAVSPLYLAGGGRRKPYTWAGQAYRAGVMDLPRFNSSLPFDETGWSQGDVIPSSSNIVFAPYGKALLSQIGALYWKSAPILVEVADEDVGTFTTVLTGIVDDVATNDNDQIVLTVADLSRALDVPLLTDRFGGTGGLDGDGNAVGRIKRRSWGQVWNVEGLLIDAANSVYEFGDPGHPIQAFTDVRDKGRSGSFSVLAAAATPAATFAALQASTPVQGGAVVAPSIACVKWWTTPVGPLTADLKGEIGASYAERPANIAARILTAVSGPALTNQSAMSTARPYAAGIHVSDDGETVAAVLDRLLMGVSLLWTVDPAGTITIRQWTLASPVASLRSLRVTRDRQFAPIATRRLGYKKNERVQNAGEISTFLTDPILTIDPASITLQADANGNLVAGQLPVTVDADMNMAGTDVSATTTFALTKANVSTSAIDVNGTFTITDASASGSVTVTGTYQGKQASKSITVTVNRAPAQVTASGQTNPLTTFGAVSSSSYPAASAMPQAGPLAYTTPASGVVPAKINLTYYGAGVQLAAKLVFRHSGDTSWTDASSEYVGGTAVAGQRPAPGTLAWTDTYTFGASANLEFGLAVRLVTGSGPVTPTGSVGIGS